MLRPPLCTATKKAFNLCLSESKQRWQHASWPFQELFHSHSADRIFISLQNNSGASEISWSNISPAFTLASSVLTHEVHTTWELVHAISVYQMEVSCVSRHPKTHDTIKPRIRQHLNATRASKLFSFVKTSL